MAMIVGVCLAMQSAEKMPESPLIAGHRRQELIGINGGQIPINFGL
jgi:hypothetical protein